MKYILNRALVGLLIASSASFAQPVIDKKPTIGELVSEVGVTKRSDVNRRNEFEIEKEKFFAKTDRHRIISIDVDKLEEKGAILTFTPFPDRSIKIRSIGVTRDANVGYYNAVFHGEMIPSGWEKDDTSDFAFTWVITTYAVGYDGNYILPDPNHLRLKELMDIQGEENRVLPVEAYSRKDEALVYAVSGEIQDIDKGGIFQFFPLPNDRGLMFLVEVDPEKKLNTSDVSDVELPASVVTERNRRSNNYKQHVAQLKERLNITDSESNGEQR